MSNREIIDQTYYKFSCAEGNQHIASKFAIQKIIELIYLFKPVKVLEIGLGIGSISGTLLKVFGDKVFRLYGTENNQFCLQALDKNLDKNYNLLSIYNDLEAIPENILFNFIIIDGSDKNLEIIRDKMCGNGIIVIEGDRKIQSELLKKSFPDHLYVHSISKRKNEEFAPFSSINWEGGIKIIFINPTFMQKIWWFREKIYTKLKYIYRTLKK